MTDKSEVEQLLMLMREEWYDFDTSKRDIIQDLTRLILYLDQRLQVLEAKED